jgi:hypothetical protein
MFSDQNFVLSVILGRYGRGNSIIPCTIKRLIEAQQELDHTSLFDMYSLYCVMEFYIVEVEMTKIVYFPNIMYSTSFFK